MRELSDEFIRELVLSQPVPLRLVEAIRKAPLLTGGHTPERLRRATQHGMRSLDPEDLNERLADVLIDVCHGYTMDETARRMFYSPESIKGMRKALLAVFRARNSPHLAALAVAQGYVDMLEAA